MAVPLRPVGEAVGFDWASMRFDEGIEIGDHPREF